jgi:hypothetical protein
MKMNKFILIISALILSISCSEQDYYELPTDENGNIVFTGISSTTTTGISTLDGSFSVTATFATAKVGDEMKVELLQLQIPSTGGTTKQLLPMAGTQKTVTVGSDMKASVTYTRDEAKLAASADYVVVVFSGKTDYAKQRVDMVPAVSVSKPTVNGKEIDVARTSEVAYYKVKVEPKAGAYSGTLVAKMKNGVNDPWVEISGSPFSGTQPFMVPIKGTDFAAGKDTMYYSFKSTSGAYTDEVSTKIIVRDPYFYMKKAATLIYAAGGSSVGCNLLINKVVKENNDTAQITLSPSLVLQGGSVWLAAGKSISFVPGTSAMYEANNSKAAIDAFNAGISTTTAAPTQNGGIYIFKVKNGANDADVYYGMLKVVSVDVPGASVKFEYRIGDQYAHLSVIK